MRDRPLSIPLLFVLIAFVSCAAIVDQPAFADDPVFDLEAIANDPLDAKQLKREVTDGIVIEHIEFTAQNDLEGNPLRTFGILAYPEGGTNLPAVMWAQGGMAAASSWAPEQFAKKGYMSLSITVNHRAFNAWSPFDADNPKNANFVRYAITHMRGITYLTNRPEVDADRIGMGGASYGGVYSTLVAGADPRVKAGMSFFSGGNHRLGTNVPQVMGLTSEEQLETFEKTADGATRLKTRKVPFLWGVAANDHWFHLPALVQTYLDNAGDKRMAILPNWSHGFTPNVDQELFDWFDIYLKGTRKPYNKPGDVTLSVSDGKLVGSWTWTGDNPVKEAKLVVSFGTTEPWRGWLNRYHHEIDATIEGQAAHAEIPVPDIDLPLYVFGNIVDENGVLISSVPITVDSARLKELGIHKPTSRPMLNTAPLGAFEPDDIFHLRGVAEMFGNVDRDVKHAGEQSIRIDLPTANRGHLRAKMQLLGVHGIGHRLQVHLRASEPTQVRVRAQAAPPQNWHKPLFENVLSDAMVGGDKAPAKDKLPAHEVIADVTRNWQAFTVRCPAPDVPIEGWVLELQQLEDGKAVYWVDDVTFEPLWPE